MKPRYVVVPSTGCCATETHEWADFCSWHTAAAKFDCCAPVITHNEQWLNKRQTHSFVYEKKGGK